MKHKIFACYCISDIGQVSPLLEALTHTGLSISQRSNFKISDDELEDVRGIIIFISEQYLANVAVESELLNLSAMVKQLPVILVRVGKVAGAYANLLVIDAPATGDPDALEAFTREVQGRLTVCLAEAPTLGVKSEESVEYRKTKAKAKRSLAVSHRASERSSKVNWRQVDAVVGGDDRNDDGSGSRIENIEIKPEDVQFYIEMFPAPSPPFKPTSLEMPASELVSPLEEPNTVQLAASAPHEVKPGEVFIANFLAYIPELEEVVRNIVEKQSLRAEMRPGLEKCRWNKGTKITVKLSAERFSIDSAEEEFEWDGEYKILSFDIEVPKRTPEGPVILKFDVFIAGIRVAKLRAEVAVKRKPTSKSKITVTGKPANKAFASYASEDLERITDRLAALRIHGGLDVYMDHLSLIPSQAWQEQLAKAIESRELFILFWSREAEKSEWVDWEWRKALELNEQRSSPEFEIHPLENGIIPPEELSHFHFGDIFMTIREAAERSKGG